ncbi:hypothetical protein FRC08_015958, partial [Ceratobasidium sp. 394]
KFWRPGFNTHPHGQGLDSESSSGSAPTATIVAPSGYQRLLPAFPCDYSLSFLDCRKPGIVKDVIISPRDVTGCVDAYTWSDPHDRVDSEAVAHTPPP